MALTRPRAAQIYNLDYKQATRAVATTNVTLSGGAPSVVDGVSLAINDRVLCTGQTAGSQNLIYVVTTVGSGSNGTWTAATDDNTTGELDAGTIVMVTEGSVYADTQWKLITDNPITIGTTSLTWTQNYSANSISAGTSNVVVSSNANVTISSAGTSAVLTVSSTGTVVKGTESVTGNITAGNVLTTGLISVTGNIYTGNILTNGYYYANGTAFSGGGGGGGTPGGANTQIQYNNNGTFGGSAAFTFNNTTNAITTTGTFSATANITGGNILTNGLINVTNTTANTITTTLTSGADANFNLTAQNGVAQNLTNTEVARFGINHGPSNTGWDSFTQYIRGSASQNGYQTLWASNTQIATINSSGILVTGVTSATGNITGGNILTGGAVSTSGTVTAASTVGGVITGSSSSVTGTQTAASTVGGVITGSSASVSGTVTAASTVGGVITGSSASVSGNVTALNHFGTNSSVTGTQTAASTVGGVITGSSVSVSGTVTSASVVGGVMSGSSLSVTTGTITGGNIVNGNGNGVGNIGSSTTYFNTVFAKATSAQYADLAEMYCADNNYPPGTVVEFGGEYEITITTLSHSTQVAGIISTNPSYLMNSTIACEENALEVALVGRVPCRVVGTIYKGDRLVSSGLHPGVATALDMRQYQPGCIVGKALENYSSTDVGVIEVAVGRI